MKQELKPRMIRMTDRELLAFKKKTQKLNISYRKAILQWINS